MKYDIVREFIADELFDLNDGISVFVSMELLEPGTLKYDNVDNGARMIQFLHEDSFFIDKEHYEIGIRLSERVQKSEPYYFELNEFLKYQCDKYLQTNSETISFLIDRTIRTLDLLDENNMDKLLDLLESDIFGFMFGFIHSNEIQIAIELVRDTRNAEVYKDTWERFVTLIHRFNSLMNLSDGEMFEFESSVGTDKYTLPHEEG
jgi:hypothetical protein